MNPFKEFPFAVGEAVTEAGEEAETLFFGGGGGGEETLHAGGIGGAGFFAKSVFARIHTFLKVLGAEAWRGGQENDVDILDGADFIDGIEADEFAIVFDLDFFGVRGFEVIVSELEAIGKGVTHGDELDIFVGGEGLASGSRAASATPDEGDFEHFAFILGTADRGEAGDGSGGDGGGGATEEVATIEWGLSGWVHSWSEDSGSLEFFEENIAKGDGVTVASEAEETAGAILAGVGTFSHYRGHIDLGKIGIEDHETI